MTQNRGRRQLLILAGVGLGWWGVSQVLRRPPPLEYSDIPALPGFRKVEGGPVSGAAFDPLFGLDAPASSEDHVPVIGAARVCDLLFRERRPGTVPVASFSDFNCPYCRILTPELARRHDAGEITVTWHELPLLGDASRRAARVAVAADFQGAYVAIHTRLMRGRVVPTAAYLHRLAADAGIDPEKLIRDTGSARVSQRIAAAKGVARVFGFFGTPALVIGNTAVLGNTTPARLDALIAAERIARSVC